MLANIANMIELADESLVVHQAQQAKVPRRDAFGLHALSVGESISAPAERAASLRVCASRMAKNGGGRFTVQKMPDGSVRCTRLEVA